MQMTSLVTTAAFFLLACVFGITAVSVVVELFLIRGRPKDIKDALGEDVTGGCSKAGPNVVPFARADRISHSRLPRS
jgi:hypothetical protein